MYLRTALFVHADKAAGMYEPITLTLQEHQEKQMQAFTAYIPMDRRQALAHGDTLPDRTIGAALFVDISGFTPLTETLATELGRKRGAEEVLRQINPIYDALIAELYRYGGSVIGFAGDAMTCWFDDDDLAGVPKPVRSIPRAVAAALAMQNTMQQFAVTRTPTGTTIYLGIKVAVASGSVRRFVVGDPDIQVLDVLAGDTLTRMAAAEGQAATGEIMVSEEVTAALTDSLEIAEWRQDSNGHRFAVVTRLREPVSESPWPPLDTSRLSEEQLQSWLLPSVFCRIQAKQRFLGDLRSVTPLFLKFGGIEYDRDAAAGEKLDAYIRWVQGILRRYEGSLIQLTVGDKGSYLYIAFGALLTHEDDTTRAFMAALALQEPPPALSDFGQVQIGVTQGQVWTGACGCSTRHTFGVMGNPVNMAARLMAHATPGQVLVSQLAADATQGRIRCRDLGVIQVKGRTTPLPIAEAVLVETSGQHLSEQFEQRMVGRDQELQQLLTFLDEVESGESRVVSIEAEAGFGKSRLVAEWAGHVRRRGLRGFLGAAQSIEQHTPYRAWRDLLSTFLGLDALTSLGERQEQVKTHVHVLASDAAVYIPLLNDILELALPDNELTKGLSAQGRQQALITMLLTLFRAAAAQSPLLLALEDVHWLDALSWELVLQLARGLQMSGTPFLLLLVTRPVETLPAPAATLRRLPYCRHLALNALPPNAIEALTANHLGVAVGSLPPDILTLIQRRSEGNPFFAEELLLHLQAHDVITVQPDPDSSQSHCHVHHQLDQIATELPDSLHGVILARIDRLPPTQQVVLKLAAVIGRTFAFPPLQHLYRHSRTGSAVTLATEIGHLEERDFVLTEALEPELTYLFKHIVLRDVAHDTLLYAQRRSLHRSMAGWYEQAHPGQDADSPYLPLLAYHYRQAEDIALERQYAYLAGQQAAARYANDDALSYFSRTQELTPNEDTNEQYRIVWAREEIYDRLGQRELQATDLAQLTTLAGTRAQQAAVALRYGAYHNNVGEYETAIAVSEQAFQWAVECGDGISQAQAMIHSGQAFMQQAAYEKATQHYQQAYELAQAVTASTQTAYAWDGLGGVAYRQADYPTAMQYHQQALNLRQEIDDLPGQVQSLRNLGLVSEGRGEYDTARKYYLHALQLAQQMGDRPYEGRVLLDLGSSDWHQGKYPLAETYLQQSLALAQSTGDRLATAASLRNLGVVTVLQRQYDNAIDYWEQSLVISQEIGNRDGEGTTLGNLGGAAWYQGQYDKAIDYFERSLLIQQEIGNRNREGAMLNNLGEVAYAQGQYDEAIDYYEQSLVIAQEIGDQDGESITLMNLGVMAYARGQYARAIDHNKESLRIRQKIGDRDGEGEVLNNLAALALIQLAFQQAQNYYRQALIIRQELNQPHFIIEDWAGLALAALLQGDLETAQAYADQLLTAWTGNPAFEGTEHPVRAFHFAWQVCRGLEMSQADEVLAAATQVMQTYLDNQPDPAAQTVYLQQPHHQALWQAWQAQQEGKPPDRT